jgi:hypothetical protein
MDNLTENILQWEHDARTEDQKLYECALQDHMFLQPDEWVEYLQRLIQKGHLNVVHRLLEKLPEDEKEDMYQQIYQ